VYQGVQRCYKQERSIQTRKIKILQSKNHVENKIMWKTLKFREVPLVSGAPKSSGCAATKGFALVRLKAPPLPINASPFPSFARGENKNLAVGYVCLRPFNNKRAVKHAKSIALLRSSRKEVNLPLSSMLTGLKRCKTR